MDGMFFYVTNEGSCKYDSTKKMVLWNFWSVICTDFIILWIDSCVYLSGNSWRECTIFWVHKILYTLVKEEKLDKVYVAGHSLGGVVATLDALTLQKENHLAGVILLASYPDKSVDFSSSNIPVLSIVASNDKILNWEKYEASKSRLPKSSEELMIEGGNHSGFGMYGEQKGDGKASISNKEQQQKVIEKLTEFMKKTK